ncbi:DUF7857 domain-containing protein [Halorientalis pallida]|uniref:DUF8080 domain-containing protein n=1 Tax=Halorientalis pallida TaxID=2479928 RepID=A0A498KZ78_9EURY|nr:hypothetical protein [Halorientalis pallida]RXK50598.1 hypothetical protein EAF64_08615 [Halorientalis pallida]
MVTLSCTASRENGVTLVTGRVENSGDARRVRLTSRLDGPLYPPRRQGVPAEGWDEDGLECVLAAEEVRPLGFASPAPPTDPPLAVAETEPVDPDDGGVEPRVAVPTVESTADGVVRALGAPRPPRDAVPTPASGTSPESRDAEPNPRESGDTGLSPVAEELDGGDGAKVARDTADAKPEDAPGGAALDAVAVRIETAERLSTATRLPEATEALRNIGGIAGARDLEAQLSRDAERLSRLATRASDLAERAEAATVPVERLDRVR